MEERIGVSLPAVRRSHGVCEQTTLHLAHPSDAVFTMTHRSEALGSLRWELPTELLSNGLFRSVTACIEDGRCRPLRYSVLPFLAEGRPFVALLLPFAGVAAHRPAAPALEPATLRFDVAWQPLFRTQRFLRLAARDGFADPA